MRELCAFAGRHRRSKDPAAAAAAPEEVAILPLFFKISPQDLKNEQKLQTWHRAWTGWQDQQGHHNMADAGGRMSCSASECEDAVRLLRSLNGIIRGPEREEGEGRYIDRVMHGSCR